MSEAREAILFKDDLELDLDAGSSSSFKRQLELPVELVNDITGRLRPARLEPEPELEPIPELERLEGEEEDEPKEVNRPLNDALPVSFVRYLEPELLELEPDPEPAADFLGLTLRPPASDILVSQIVF